MAGLTGFTGLGLSHAEMRRRGGLEDWGYLTQRHREAESAEGIGEL